MRVIRLSDLEQFAAVNLNADLGHIAGPKIIPQGMEVRLNFTLESGKIGHIVLCGRYPAAYPGSTAMADALLTALGTVGAWTTLATFFATATAFSSISLRDLATAGNPYAGSVGSAKPGTSASPSLPNETSAVITLFTAKTGPQNRGRMFVPGWATNALGAGNVIAAAAVTALNNWAALIAPAFTAQGLTWSIAQPARAAYTSPLTGRVFPARTATSINVTGAVARDNHWDSQRRRGLK